MPLSTAPTPADAAATAPTPADAAGAAAGTPATSPAGTAAAGGAAHTGSGASGAAATPGFKPPPPPQVTARRAEAKANAPAKPSQLVELLGAPGAPVRAVESGRIEHLGHSHSLGRYLVLRDVYGDVFTYAGLGSIAPRYRPTLPTLARRVTASQDPAPTQPATAGHQSPLTLKVRHHAAPAPLPSASTEAEGETAPAGMGRVRLYAHPGNPIARAAAASAAKAAGTGNGRWLPLRSGSIVSEGTVLGRLDTPVGASAGQLRFAVRPAGDSGTIDPQPLLANWRQLGAALHPKGSKGANALLGATAGDALEMSKAELELAVLSDPGVQLDACGRRDVASGAVDGRVLAVLEFLSRSGLQPTVAALRCPRGGVSPSGLSVAPSADAAAARAAHDRGTAVEITAINGVPIAGHQGQGTVADAAIRTLLTLSGRFAPHRIVSLMQYPEAPHHAGAPLRVGPHLHRLPPAAPGEGPRRERPRRGGLAADGDGRPERGAVESADRAHRGAAEADCRHGPELDGDPRPAGRAHQPRTGRPRLKPPRAPGPHSRCRAPPLSRVVPPSGRRPAGGAAEPGTAPSSRLCSSGRRSAGCAATTGGPGAGFGPQTGEQRAPALRLGRFELGAAGVEPLGVEDRAFARGVGFAHVDPVLAQARGEASEHFVEARAVEGVRRPAEVAAAREVRAARFERFRVLRARHALGQLRTTDRRGSRRPRGCAGGG